LERATAYEWREYDRTVYRTQEPDERTRVLPFITAENSRLLRAGTFIEPEFGYTAIRIDDDVLFYYDTRGSTPKVVNDHFRPLRPPDLQVLFPDGSSSLTSVSLLNTDIGRQAPRSRRIRAAAIDDLAPDLSDFAYVCTIAEGYTEFEDERFRRYLGLSRSRINDYRPGERDYRSYSDWLEALKSELEHGSANATTFTRYATYVDKPDLKEPIHVLLDIDPTDFVQAGSGDPLELADRVAEVRGGTFSISVGQTEHTAVLAWDAVRDRYDLSIPSLQDELFIAREGERRELVAAINADQSMRIVPEERTTIYAHGSFFQPIIPTTRVGSFRLLDVLSDSPELGAATSEKGRAIINDDWEPSSVFGLMSAIAPDSGRTPAEPIRRLMAPTLVLCTDMGSEVADFVVASDGRIVFAHAKASSMRRLYSASALHEVAAQAIKNLHHLQPLVDSHMATGGWVGNWSASHVTGTTRRLRYGNFTSGPAIWKYVRSLIADPDTEREVWLVIGNSLSKAELQRQAGRRQPSRPEAEALQVFCLLQTTWGAVSQLGARLRIFCSP
jgi:hypothetical protein